MVFVTLCLVRTMGCHRFQSYATAMSSTTAMSSQSAWFFQLQGSVAVSSWQYFSSLCFLCAHCFVWVGFWWVFVVVVAVFLFVCFFQLVSLGFLCAHCFVLFLMGFFCLLVAVVLFCLFFYLFLIFQNQLKKIPRDMIAEFNLGCQETDIEHTYRVYVTTFLGYGANSAIDRYQDALTKNYTTAKPK